MTFFLLTHRFAQKHFNLFSEQVTTVIKPSLRSHLCRCSSWAPTPCITCLLLCLASFSDSMCGINTSSKPKSKRLCLELSGRKKNAPKHKVMKALRMRRRMNFSESRKVALWCGNEEAPGERVGILRPESGNSAGVVIFWWWTWIWWDKCQGCFLCKPHYYLIAVKGSFTIECLLIIEIEVSCRSQLIPLALKNKERYFQILTVITAFNRSLPLKINFSFHGNYVKQQKGHESKFY